MRSTKRIVELVLAEIKKLALMVHCIPDAEENMDSLMFFSVDKVMVAIEDRIGYLHNIYKSQVRVRSGAHNYYFRNTNYQMKYKLKKLL